MANGKGRAGGGAAATGSRVGNPTGQAGTRISGARAVVVGRGETARTEFVIRTANGREFSMSPQQALNLSNQIAAGRGAAVGVANAAGTRSTVGIASGSPAARASLRQLRRAFTQRNRLRRPGERPLRAPQFAG